MKINCLMGTYGRYDLVCESLAGFLGQTRLDAANLIILNQHPIPLYFDHPRVRVVNEQMPKVGLRHIRKRMFDLADPTAELTHWWDDDDLYMPWHIEDGLHYIRDNLAWKQYRHWLWYGTGEFELRPGLFEGAWTLKSEAIRNAPLDTHPTYPDHPVNMQLHDAGKVAETELGELGSYIYRWGTGTPHLSQQTYDSASDITDSVDKVRAHVDEKIGENAVRNGGVLVPADLRPRWQQFLAGVEHLVSPENFMVLQNRLLG